MMESTFKFLDEMYDKYKHQAENFIEELDYLQFSPDKRCALLDGEIQPDTTNDIPPLSDILQEKQVNWDAMNDPNEDLEDYDMGSNIINMSNLSYEMKIVHMCTPVGGIQGLPDPEVTRRFLAKCVSMNPDAIAQAFAHRLIEGNWQNRSKALSLISSIMENKNLASRYGEAFTDNRELMGRIDAVRMKDPNHHAREAARKALSLIISKGENDKAVAPRPASPKNHVRHVQHHQMTNKKNKVNHESNGVTRFVTSSTVKPSSITKAPNLSVNTDLLMMSNRHLANVVTSAIPTVSPRVKMAALASWRRRMSSSLQQEETPNLMPFQTPNMKKTNTMNMQAPAPIGMISTTYIR